MGLSAALFLCLGLLVISGKRSDLVTRFTSNQNLLGTLPPGTPLGNASSLQSISLGVFFNKIQLLAEYWSQPGVLKPRGSYVTTAGFMLGHQWQPISGTLVQQGAHLRYTAVLRHEWMLLGSPVFSSLNEYTGLMPNG